MMAVFINQMLSLIKDIALLTAVEWEKPLDRCFVGSLGQLILAVLHRQCDRCEKYYMAAPATKDKKEMKGFSIVGMCIEKHVIYDMLVTLFLMKGLNIFEPWASVSAARLWRQSLIEIWKYTYESC